MELQDLSQLSVEDFSAFLNKKLKIKFDENHILEAELIAARQFNNYSPLERKPFSLVFRTDQKTDYFMQAIYILIHPEKNEIPLFLVPLGLDAEGMKYEAVFS